MFISTANSLSTLNMSGSAMILSPEAGMYIGALQLVFSLQIVIGNDWDTKLLLPSTVSKTVDRWMISIEPSVTKPAQRI